MTTRREAVLTFVTFGVLATLAYFLGLNAPGPNSPAFGWFAGLSLAYVGVIASLYIELKGWRVQRGVTAGTGWWLVSAGLLFLLWNPFALWAYSVILVPFGLYVLAYRV